MARSNIKAEDFYITDSKDSVDIRHKGFYLLSINKKTGRLQRIGGNDSVYFDVDKHNRIKERKYHKKKG